MGRLAGVALGFALIGAGCAEKRPTVVHVKGQVFWEGKPAAGAVVYFHTVTETVDSQNPAKGRRPRGIVAEDGTFEMSTYGKKDGVPAGSYRVSVVWAQGTGDADEATHLMPAKFMSPTTAGLPIVEIGDRPTVLEPFRLSN